MRNAQSSCRSVYLTYDFIHYIVVNTIQPRDLRTIENDWCFMAHLLGAECYHCWNDSICMMTY